MPIKIKPDEVPEEQIWGKKSNFYEKKLYRDDKIAINLRRTPAQEAVQSEEGYQLHSHGDSMEIVVNLRGKVTGYYDPGGEFGAEGGDVVGDIVVIPPNTKHGLVSVQEELLALAIFIPPPKARY